MMVKLFRKVRGLLRQELDLARAQNGEYFNSVHEGYGVLVEENTEAWDESIDTHASLDDLLRAMMRDDHDGVMAAAKEIERHASLAACEYIQVAAMARKLRESERMKK